MSEPSKQAFFPRIEAWRGLAALLVAWFHGWQSPWLDAAGKLRSFTVPEAGDSAISVAMIWLARLTTNGTGAVSAFFVMSGFVLALSLARGPSELRKSALRFTTGRLFRLYPAIISTVALFALIFWTTGAGLGGDYTRAGVLRNMLLLDTSIDGVMWSLQVEVIASFAIFLGFVAERRWGPRALVALSLLTAGASFAGHQMRALGPDLTLLCAFYFGMTAYHYGERIRLGAAGSVAVFAAMCAARPLLGYASHWAALVEAILAAVVVAQLAFGQLGRLGDLFDWNITRFFGQISYSFYLLHPLTLLVAWHIPNQLGAVVHAGVSAPLVAAGLAVVTIAAITPIAWLSYRYVERPAVAIGKVLASGQRQRPPKILKRGI